MYPSSLRPTYGVFVKQTYDWLIEKYDVSLVKITKQNSFLDKLVAYFIFYIKAVFFGVIKRYDCLYAHFISHSALPVKIIKVFRPHIIVVGNIHGEDVFSEFNRFKRNRRFAELFLKQADYIISPSIYFKKKLVTEYGYPDKKIIVSPSGGVDTDLFLYHDMNTSKRMLKLDTSKKYIGFVSRLEPGKGCDVLLSAFSNLDDYELLIVGSGRNENSYRRLVHELKIDGRVQFIPLLPHNQLVYLYNSLDIFCFPSSSESLGLVGLEAMACECLCILSDAGGIMSYAVDQKNSLVFQRNNVDDLFRKMKDIIELKPDMVGKMKKNARITALAFSSEKTRMGFLNFFSGML